MSGRNLGSICPVVDEGLVYPHVHGHDVHCHSSQGWSLASTQHKSSWIAAGHDIFGCSGPDLRVRGDRQLHIPFNEICETAHTGVCSAAFGQAE
jgi:hypothetical protein